MLGIFESQQECLMTGFINYKNHSKVIINQVLKKPFMEISSMLHR
jgi:hypothetical protein